MAREIKKTTAKKKPGKKVIKAHSTIILPETSDILAVKNIKKNIEAALAKSSKLTIDASKVTKITTPCIQLLLSTHSYLKSKSGSMKLVKASLPYKEAFANLGVGPMLKNWSLSNNVKSSINS